MRMGGATMTKWGVALALGGLAAPPLLAQQVTTNAITPAPAPAPDTVGPRELRDFSLPGTVTRPTNTPPAGTTNSTRPTEAPPPDAAPLAVRSRPVASTEMSRSVTVALPPPDPLAREPTLAPPVDEVTPSGSQPAIATAAPPPSSPSAVDDSGSWCRGCLRCSSRPGSRDFLLAPAQCRRLAYTGGAGRRAGRACSRRTRRSAHGAAGTGPARARRGAAPAPPRSDESFQRG